MFLWKLFYVSRETLTLPTENTTTSFSALRTPSRWQVFRDAISERSSRSSSPAALALRDDCPSWHPVCSFRSVHQRLELAFCYCLSLLWYWEHKQGSEHIGLDHQYITVPNIIPGTYSAFDVGLLREWNTIHATCPPATLFMLTYFSLGPLLQSPFCFYGAMGYHEDRYLTEDHTTNPTM